MATINLGKVAPVYKGTYVAGTYQKYEVVFDGESSFISLVDNNVTALANDGVHWRYLCRGNYLATQAQDASILSAAPIIPYVKRLEADTATQLDKTAAANAFNQYLTQLPETVLLFNPQCGLKERTSGINKYVSTLYSLKSATYDAVQATTGTQPYSELAIAPNAKKGVKYLGTQTQTGLLDFTDVSFSATNAWSLTLAIKINKKSSGASTRIYFGSAMIVIGLNTLTIVAVGSIDALVGTYDVGCGKTYIIEFVYNNGVGCMKVNGIRVPTTCYSTEITFGDIHRDINEPFDGVLYHIHLTNTQKSEYQSNLDYNFLRAIYPDIEGVNIGNQHWQTSNYEGVVTANGTVIPEVQNASAWAALTTPAWCYYNNDPALGAVYGKLYNHYAVDAIALNPPTGWRVPTKADFTQLIAYLGGSTVAGGKVKKDGLDYWGDPNTSATNESGLSIIGSGIRVGDGLFERTKSYGFIQSLDYSYLTTRYGYYCYGGNGIFDISAGIIDASAVVGMPLRLIRTSPVGEQVQKLSTGIFTTDISSSYKLLNIPFGYQVTAIKVNCASNVTNFKCDMYDYAGSVLQATLVTGKTATANIPIKFGVVADSPIQYQDAQLRFTCAKAVSTANLEIVVVIEKIL